MVENKFFKRSQQLKQKYDKLIKRKNIPLDDSNGIYERYAYPVLTAEHTPLFWRYDLNEQRNPFLMERLGINAVFNPGAIEMDDTLYLVVRVEGKDRKSFFAVAESKSGVDDFTFWDYPLTLPQTEDPDINVYDMRLVRHEDGWIYGLFCTERKDPKAPRGDVSSAIARCGIARTKDLRKWERFPDLRTPSAQQRNVALHPEFIGGKYAFYTRPQDGFIDAGSGGGIGWGLSESMKNAVIEQELIMDERKYHTVKEVKNGLGPSPIRTEHGWIHLAHGVRGTAAGLRYVLYVFMTDLHEPWRVTHAPGGYFLAPEGEERIGDVSNVVFSNGWVLRKNGEIMLYYASSDTRIHVATTSIERLIDYVMNTPEDPGRSMDCVTQRNKLISDNLENFGTIRD